MKKFKHLPTILMLVLCLVALTIGVYAIQHTQNRIIGSVTIKASNPAVKLTMYYVPNDTTVEEAVQNDANKIGKTKTARYGVELDLTDDRLNFGMTGVNVLEDVKTKTIAIKIENPSDKVLGAYFADQSNISKVKTTTTLSTYTSKTSFTEENLVDDDYARADFSDYTQVPAKEGETNGQAIVTMSISLLDLTLVELYIKVDTAFIIEDYDAGKGEINLQTDPHLAVNVTAEDYESVPTALSTTDTTIDAEVYNISGAYVGLVNMQYSDATATALSAKQKNGYVKPLGAVPLAGETVTFSFNYSVTASDGTVTTAANIFTDEKASEGLVGIGIGNYNGFAGLLPTLMTGGA
ncbi:MAG: hypothetical protein IJW25_00015, partial [Clostridia bacterium]|nr:hypothetical protein [Clostridia bacterium]